MLEGRGEVEGTFCFLPSISLDKEMKEVNPHQAGTPRLWLFRPQEVISAFKLHLGFFTDEKKPKQKTKHKRKKKSPLWSVCYFAYSKRKIFLYKPVYKENRGAQTGLHYHNLFHITNVHCNSYIF